MKVVFADTFLFLALVNPHDQHREQTTKLVRHLRARIVTTDYILLEVADALSKGEMRSRIGPLMEQVRASPFWEVAPFSTASFDAALSFHAQHHDKRWTLTDCTSFLTMRERGITEALTGDHHFEQAGFIALLK